METKSKGVRFWQTAALSLAASLLAAQWIVSTRTNPSFTGTQTIEAMVGIPADVRSTLNRSCADCHSDETRWPWYSRIAPVSWYVAGHVNKGRRYINLSTWVRPGHEPQDSIDRLKAMCREVQNSRMPLLSYRLIHWDSWLSARDVSRICEWSETEQKRLGASAH